VLYRLSYTGGAMARWGASTGPRSMQDAVKSVPAG
jgi:hypothetical protein